MDEVELRKLEVRLTHWIKHSREHGKDFGEAAKKAGEGGRNVVRGHLLQAAQRMEETASALERALAALNS